MKKAVCALLIFSAFTVQAENKIPTHGGNGAPPAAGPGGLKLNQLSLRAANPDHWETTGGTFPVEGHVLELIQTAKTKKSGQKLVTQNPVRFRAGFQIKGARRMDLSHRAGQRSVDVTRLNSKGQSDMKNRRIVEIEPGETTIEFHLPAGMYRVLILGSNGGATQGGWVSDFVQFEVVGSNDPEKTPDPQTSSSTSPREN